MDPTDPDVILAGSDGAGIFGSADAAANWLMINSGLSPSYVRRLVVDPTNSMNVYAGTAGGVFRSTDAASTWVDANTGLTNVDITALAIDAFATATLYVGTDGSGVFNSTDRGGSWTATNNGIADLDISAVAVEPVSSMTLYAGTEGGGVFKTIDGGASWAASNAGLLDLSVSALAIDPTDPQTLYAGTLLNVAPGYARNFLYPRGIALEATKGNMRQLEKQRDRADQLASAERDEAKSFAERIEGTEISFTLKAGEMGQLYGSVSQQDIIAVLTTGRTLQDLTGGTGTGNFTGDLAANYFASALTGRFERQLERALGLERVQINPLLVEGQTDPTTRITVGKEVHDDLMLVFSTEIGSEQFQIYQVEWRASRKYQVTLQQHSQFGVGGQIQYADRWWWKKPPRQSVPVAPLEGDEEGEQDEGADRPSGPAGGPLIAAVRIEGGRKALPVAWTAAVSRKGRTRSLARQASGRAHTL